MAQKTASKKVIKYVPVKERGEDKPTIVCFRPLSKGQFDEYLDSLVETRRNKTITKTGKSGEMLFKKCLATDEDGVFIYNVYIDETFVEKIDDRDRAVKFLLDMADVETANEIEQAMRGFSTLDGEEEKNSDGQSEPH